jgi:hypothetical protein
MNHRGVRRAEIAIVLVVICLGSLVSLGAIERTRQDARLALCAGNMRTIGAALLAYAAGSQQTLPPECLRRIQDYTPAFSSYVTDIDGNPWGFGRLLSGGYLSSARTVFCPSQSVKRFAFDPTMATDWPKGKTEAPAGYLYQVHTVRNTGLAPFNATATKDFGDAELFICAAYTKVNEFPPHLFVSMEIVDSLESVPHDKGTTMNALLIDGSVTTVITDAFAKVMKDRGTSPMANLQAFSDAVTIWEEAAKLE